MVPLKYPLLLNINQINLLYSTLGIENCKSFLKLIGSYGVNQLNYNSVENCDVKSG